MSENLLENQEGNPQDEPKDAEHIKEVPQQLFWKAEDHPDTFWGHALPILGAIAISGLIAWYTGGSELFYTFIK